jgi:arsenite oxidase small subunit
VAERDQKTDKAAPSTGVRRRDFLKLGAIAGAGIVAGGGAGFVAGQAVQASVHTPAQTPTGPTATGFAVSAYPRVKVGTLSSLNSGEPIPFDYPLRGLRNLLVKLGEPAENGIGPDRDIVAYSALCTHMGCSLVDAYDKTHKVLGPCSCHFTTFDLSLDGMPIIGCATEPLARVLLQAEPNGDIYAVGVDGLVYGQRDNLRDRPAL